MRNYNRSGRSWLAWTVLLLAVPCLFGQTVDVNRDTVRHSDVITIGGPADAQGVAADSTANKRITRDRAFSAVVVVADGSIRIIDSRTNTISGPFLMGQMATAEDILMGVAVTSDGKTALIGNFIGNLVNFVDLTNPSAPVWRGSVLLNDPVLSIELTPDDRYAVVNMFFNLAVIDVPHQRVVRQNLFAGKTGDPQSGDAAARGLTSVAVAGDGQTVLFADFLGQAIYVLRLDPASGQLTLANTIDLGGVFTPGIITFSPDGSTALVTSDFGLYTKAPVLSTSLLVLHVDRPGSVSVRDQIELSGNMSRAQSVCFSRDGRQVYVLGDLGQIRSRKRPYIENGVLVLQFNSAGRLEDTGVVIPLTLTAGEANLGADMMAVDPYNHFLYVSSELAINGQNEIAVVSLQDFRQVDTLYTGDGEFDFPTGIAFPQWRLPRPVTQPRAGNQPADGSKPLRRKK